MADPAGADLGQKLFRLANEAATDAFGQLIAARLERGDCITLSGELGVGKTRLARSIIQALVGMACPVPSPTFTLTQTYDTPLGRLWHFDLYRLGSAEELVELGWDEALSETSLIEWPCRADGYLPNNRIDIALSFGGEPDERSAVLTAPVDWAVQTDGDGMADRR